MHDNIEGYEFIDKDKLNCDLCDLDYRKCSGECDVDNGFYKKISLPQPIKHKGEEI